MLLLAAIKALCQRQHVFMSKNMADMGQAGRENCAGSTLPVYTSTCGLFNR